jgi:glycosyltransferase involved in cell wall biosynthesis
VASGADVRSSLPASDDRIRYMHLGEAARDIGSVRNIGCEHARGSVIAHWDDDDFSAPGRISDQVERLSSSGRAVTGYRSMRFTDSRRWWLYAGGADYALGTSLCYRRDWWAKHPFLPLQVGEDNAFVRTARTLGELVVADAGALMYATIHQNNTSPRNLRGKAWRLLEGSSLAA